jgi:chromodomain-helicase-DNA-binding protein 1
MIISSGEWENSDDFGSSDEKKVRRPIRRSAAPRNSRSVNNKSRPKNRRVVRSSSESETDESEDESRRQKTRRANVKKVSYKEQSDHTDSDDLVEVDWTNYEAETETGETVERILEHRMGKKGATGLETAPYQVEANGDPNDESAEEKELQFLTKWKGWSHLHNTWETEESLKEVKAKGIKKLENYLKKEEEIRLW